MNGNYCIYLMTPRSYYIQELHWKRIDDLKTHRRTHIIENKLILMGFFNVLHNVKHEFACSTVLLSFWYNRKK